MHEGLGGLPDAAVPEQRARPSASRVRPHARAIAAVAIAIAIATVMVSLALVWVSNRALLAPRSLELWSHDFNADGDAIWAETSREPPWPNEPISLEEVLRRDTHPVIVHQTSGPLLIGLTVVTMPKPASAPKAIYLQVGSDAYVPYYWVRCCESEW